MKNQITFKRIIAIVFLGVILNFLLTERHDVIGFISSIFALLMPLVVGIALAFVINIPMSFYERLLRKIIKSTQVTRAASLIAAVLSILAALVLIGILVVPQLIENIRAVGEVIPGAYYELTLWIAEYEKYISPEIVNFFAKSDWESMLERLYATFETDIINLLDDTVTTLGSIVSGVVNFAVGLILAIYFLISREKIGIQCVRFVEIYLKKASDKIFYLVDVINSTFKNFIMGQCAEAFILGTLCIIGMTFLDLPYAAMIGTLIGFTSLIPILGPFIGFIIGAALILMVSPMDSLVFMIFVLILQQIEGNLIYPHVMGGRVGIPPMCVLFAITVGGALGGLFGILLSVPIFGVLYVILKDNMKFRENKNAKESGSKQIEVDDNKKVEIADSNKL